MGISSKTVVGLSPKYHPPGWTLRLCEEVLDDCWKAAEETRSHAGAGGTDAAYRSAQHAVAGEGNLFTRMRRMCLVYVLQPSPDMQGPAHLVLDMATIISITEMGIPGRSGYSKDSSQSMTPFRRSCQEFLEFHGSESSWWDRVRIVLSYHGLRLVTVTRPDPTCPSRLGPTRGQP